MTPLRLPNPIHLMIVIVICATSTICGQDGERSRVASSFQATQRAAASLSIKETRSSKLQSSPLISHQSIRMIRHDDRFGFLVEQQGKNEGAAISIQSRYLYKGGEAIQFNSIDNSTVGDDFFPIFISPRIADTSSHFDESWPTDGNFEPIAFGVMSGKELYEKNSLESATLAQSDESTEVRFEDSRGKFTIHCDPKMGYLPIKIELEQLPRHYQHGRLISGINMNGGKVWPAGKINSIRWIIDCELANSGVIKKTPYIKSWKSVQELDCAAGVVVTTTAECNVDRIDFDLNPRPQDFLTGLNIERGQRLFVDEASHLKYQWDGEWAVPASASLVKDNVAPSGKPWLVITGVTILAVVFFGLSIYFIKRR